MAKNILIFADGTGQAGGLKPDQTLSNIYKLYRATRSGPDSDIDPGKQVAYYDAGLGTDADSARVPFRFLRTLRKFISSATGTGISSNIVDCYAAILKHYEPGDRIYLFGFSRGAYTARCVAGVLNLCGVPTHDIGGGQMPRYGRRLKAIASEAVRSVYEHGAGKERKAYEPEREEKAKRFREKYGAGTAQSSNTAPYFIGVFDTVAALGVRGLRRWLVFAFIFCVFVVLPASILFALGAAVTIPFYVIGFGAVTGVHALLTRLRVIRDFPEKGQLKWHLAGWKSGFYDRFLDSRVRYARHALAIDERRADFARVAWGARSEDELPRLDGEPERFQQIWFAGCHSDIGGGYPEDESRLSDVALQWMVEQVTRLHDPVALDRTKLYLFPSALGMQHCEVERLMEIYPNWVPARWRMGWQVHPRVEALGATWHPSVEVRFNGTAVQQCGWVKPYRPEILRKDSRVSDLYLD